MKRLMVTVLVLCTGLCTLSARTPGQQPEGYPAIGAPGIVKLITAGAAPRSALRYVVPAGAKEHMDTTTSISMSMNMGGTAIPAMALQGMKMGADIAVTEVSAAGDITYTMVFSGMSAPDGADPSMADLLQKMGDDFKAIKGSVIISNRGVTRSTTMDYSKVANPQVAQMMGTMTAALNNVSMPLPEEEVGVGARWESRNSISANGITMHQKTECELVAFDGKTVTLKTKVEQTAPPQSISNPAMPSGMSVQLKEMTGLGSGTAALRLDALVPTGDATMESTVVTQIDMGGNLQEMAVTTSLKMTVAPGK